MKKRNYDDDDDEPRGRDKNRSKSSSKSKSTSQSSPRSKDDRSKDDRYKDDRYSPRYKSNENPSYKSSSYPASQSSDRRSKQPNENSKQGGRYNTSYSARDTEANRQSEDSDASTVYLFDKDERKRFVSKVYAILSLQLTVTFGIIFGVTSFEAAREFMMDYFWIAIIFAFADLILYCVLVCVDSVRKSYPLNFILLWIHTLMATGLATFISGRYDMSVIWLAFLATAIITILISLIAKFSPWDVTGCGILFLVAFIALMVFSIVAIIVNIFIHAPLLYVVLSGVAVVALSFYLMFVTQLILGGRKGEIEPDEVILAVIILYSTILDIFLHMLRLIAACTED